VATNNWWKGYKPFLDLAPTPENSVGLSYQHLALSPPWVLLTHWRVADLDWLWLQTDQAHQWVHHLGIGAVLCACLLAVLGLWKFGAARQLGAWVWVPVLPAIPMLQISGGSVSVGYAGLSPETAQAIASWVQPPGPTPYTLVTMSNEFHIYFFEGFLKGNFIHQWYSPSQTTHFETIAENTKGQWLSFVADQVHLQPTDSGLDLERWLNQHYYRFDAQWLGGFQVARYARLAAAQWNWQPVQLQFGPLHIDKFATNTAQLSPQDVLGVQLEICKTAEVTEDHTLFVHLLAKGGAIVQGLDGPVQYGTLDVSQWKTGECLIEKRGLYVPPGALPGAYDLILGVYTPEGRIVTTDETGQAVTYRHLAQIGIWAPSAH
jgi:hypothetical protein